MPSNLIAEKALFFLLKAPQFFATFVASLGSFSLGNCFGWTSISLPEIVETNYFGKDINTSWIASFAILGGLFCGPLAGLLLRLGRKTAMIIFSIFLAIGWFCIAFAPNYQIILVGRFITGLSSGSFTVMIPVYVSEIAEDKLKGVLGSAMVLNIVLGILFSQIVGSFTSWIILTLICSTVPIFQFLTLLLIPESPLYLLEKGKSKEASNSLKWLRGAKDIFEIQEEFYLMEKSIGLNQGRRSKDSTFKELLKPSVIKPLLVIIILFFFQQLGGINGIINYTVSIFTLSGSSIDPKGAKYATIMIGVVQVIFVLLSVFLMSKLDNKNILIVSYFIMSLSLLALSAYFYMLELKRDPPAFIPIVSLMLFIIAYSFGAGPLPWILMADILPPRVKDLCSAIATTFYWLLAFISLKTFEDFGNFLGWDGSFLLYSLINLGGLIFTIFFIPKTRGKTPEEIQAYFGGTPLVVDELTPKIEINSNNISSNEGSTNTVISLAIDYDIGYDSANNINLKKEDSLVFKEAELLLTQQKEKNSER